ncbi:MAG: AAA family ATPase, partial [Candidatus Pacebacteria bacterium]|nr:AAA family ATPase [Candidatus Paceibacterota bacterium]
MFLRRLELNGFKSFAGKTVLDFPRGVTAIVGPNGSGKSNVIDAIRWLLGERDAKNLRGGKVEDLIFAGTSGKAKAGMATAAIFFDNSSKFFPVDFEEVEIKRQVERDGNSNYFLNKSEVRLKDLVELLSKSRMGTKGLIIIGQGNSDLFIKASPSLRREMVEEMLGLREFRLKKQEAERKLKATEFNMEKAGALLLEIVP